MTKPTDSLQGTRVCLQTPVCHSERSEESPAARVIAPVNVEIPHFVRNDRKRVLVGLNTRPRNLLGYKDRSLWLWVAGGFLLLAIVWTVLFTVARSAKIESVPLAAQPGKP